MAAGGPDGGDGGKGGDVVFQVDDNFSTSVSYTHLEPETPSYPKGDLDNDGKIDTSDIFAAMVYVAYKGAGLDLSLIHI